SAQLLAEAQGCEIHRELVWDRYRFVEFEEKLPDKQPLELHLTTITGASRESAHYAIRVGRNPFSGMKLAVFLKGIGSLILPSLDPGAAAISVFQSALQRYDVFAVGYARVLPLGKVA